jgi:quercetin dioxygenase-like cupin family protein
MSAHLEAGFGPLQLELLDQAERDAALAHLEGCAHCQAAYREHSEAAAALALSAAPARPAPELRERLLRTVAGTSRFEAFAEQVAQLIDVGVDKARALLARIDDAAAWVQTPLEGVSSYDLPGGPAVADAVVGFVRIKPGCVFPEHTHEGDEAALVLQGSCLEDNGRLARRGDLVRMRRGSQHALTAQPGPDFIYLGIAHRGFVLLGMHVKPGDPRY